MKTIRVISAALAAIIALTSCDVHEFPDVTTGRPVCIRLHYDTDMTVWNHVMGETGTEEEGTGPIEDNVLNSGFMRYVIRAYPVSGDNNTEYRQEFVFIRNVGDGYDAEFRLALIPGDYSIMVWADLISHKDGSSFYDAGNFAEIYLAGDYTGDTDYRDAFRGISGISITCNISEEEYSLDIMMQRPMAKYEFITADLAEFMAKENIPRTKLDMDKYRIIFHYAGFMPDAYNMNTDRPVDSAAGIMFESRPEILNEHEASLGFDYVFAGEKESSVVVQVGLYDEVRMIALTDPIRVPLRRSFHTKIRGSFLMRQASGGLVINPEFEGNYNIIYGLN